MEQNVTLRSEIPINRIILITRFAVRDETDKNVPIILSFFMIVVF